MTDVIDAENIGRKNRSKKTLLSYWWAPIGTVILGAIGSGVWDVLAKPGLSSLGRLFLSILSFGSTRVRDYAYENAALDPYPMPAVLLSGALAGAMLVIGTLFVMLTLAALRTKNDEVKSGHDTNEANSSRISKQISVRRRVLVAVTIMLSLIIVELYVSLAISVAVSLKRTFESNILICSPLLSTPEEKRFRAQFAAIRTKTDYEALDASFRSLCTSRGARLRELSLW